MVLQPNTDNICVHCQGAVPYTWVHLRLARVTPHMSTDRLAPPASKTQSSLMTYVEHTTGTHLQPSQPCWQTVKTAMHTPTNSGPGTNKLGLIKLAASSA